VDSIFRARQLCGLAAADRSPARDLCTYQAAKPVFILSTYLENRDSIFILPLHHICSFFALFRLIFILRIVYCVGILLLFSLRHLHATRGDNDRSLPETDIERSLGRPAILRKLRFLQFQIA
jgi:hypothetical protein